MALTEGSASAGGLSNEVTAGAAVKKAAQQVETQAQILSTQLNNRVSDSGVRESRLMCITV